MMAPELHETLEALLAAMSAETHPRAPVVVAADITAPMEVRVERRDGRLTAFAAPPASRWQSGWMAPVHRVYLAAEAMALAPAEVEGRP